MIWILNTYQWLVLLLNQGAKAYCEYNLGFFFSPTVSECICGLEERSYMETDQWYSETYELGYAMVINTKISVT